jgi:hypothetical protein
VTGRSGRPAAGGGRWVLVPPQRLERWLDGFEARHGPVRCEADAQRVSFAAPDGARAECEVPFAPLSVDAPSRSCGLVAHACRDRVVGVLLVRLGGHAAGVFEGPRLVASKVGSRPVHGRSAAGGWSQQRFARRRENQAKVAIDAAAAVAAGILLPVAQRLDAVVAGGDRRAVDAVLADERLLPLRALLSGELLDVPDPDRRVLDASYERFTSVRIRVIDG